MSNKEALQHKDLGNEAYKRKDFDAACSHYDKAIQLDPNNITFYSNKAAVLFEQQKYEECIELCNKAVDVGRDQRSDYALIAKALTRIGNAYVKMGSLREALKWYDKSLSEYRDPELVKKRQQLEKDLNESERVAYINPTLAEEEKNKGNELFKTGDFPGAMRHYNEAVKRHPDNAVLYSNRAACYTKLMAFDQALADCETCIKKDPKFIKGYIRKGAALVAMKEFSRAQHAYEEALKLDSSNKEARDGLMASMRQNDEDPAKARERAMNDPEVQAILRDPAMRLVLEQMSSDPGAVKEHLRNPEIFEKLMKLRDAGIVQMR